MTPPTVLGYVRATPFRPFRIHMASGKTFDVRHPELIKVGRTSKILSTPSEEGPDVVDAFETASLMLAESISHPESSVA